MTRLRGVGLGFRAETAWMLCRSTRLHFTEVLAEQLAGSGPRIDAMLSGLDLLREAGLPVALHSVGLSLGSGAPPDRGRLRRLRRLAQRLDAVIVSDHLAFVRSGSVEVEHLLPVRRTRATLEVVAENIDRAQQALGQRIALENIAAVFEWPQDELPEAEFLAALHQRTGCALLLDTSNLFANHVNLGWDVTDYLSRLPLEAVAYVHTAGGREVEGFYRDTHADPVTEAPLEVLAQALRERPGLAVLLERDGRFSRRAELLEDLERVRRVLDGRPERAPEALRVA